MPRPRADREASRRAAPLELVSELAPTSFFISGVARSLRGDHCRRIWAAGATFGDALSDRRRTRHKAETAIFEWPETELPETGADFVEYCGWVNGKNAYGAYAGFVSFSVWLVMLDGEITSIQFPSGSGSGGVPSPNAVCVEQGSGRS